MGYEVIQPQISRCTCEICGAQADTRRHWPEGWGEMLRDGQNRKRMARGYVCDGCNAAIDEVIVARGGRLQPQCYASGYGTQCTLDDQHDGDHDYPVPGPGE